MSQAATRSDAGELPQLQHSFEGLRRRILERSGVCETSHVIRRFQPARLGSLGHKDLGDEPRPEISSKSPGFYIGTLKGP